MYPSTDWSHHDYRDCSIENYVKVAEALADRGFYVVRVGAKVRSPIPTAYSKVIDYATNGKQSDFLDLYLGARCALCISNGTGFDRIADAFRRPISYIGICPAGYLVTGRSGSVQLVKHHVHVETDRELTLSEIFSSGVGYGMSGAEYASRGVRLIENDADEIFDVVMETVERLEGTWQAHPQDEALQARFWEIFPVDAVDPDGGRPLHGNITARYSAAYLRKNPWWLA